MKSYSGQMIRDVGSISEFVEGFGRPKVMS